MLNQQVITEKFPVTLRDEVRNFSVRLPRHAARVIGIEHGVRIIGPAITPPDAVKDHVSSFDIKPSRHFGSLHLSHPGCAGVFYAVELNEPGSLIAWGDFSAIDDFSPQSESHGFQMLEDPIVLPRQAQVIQGMYRDDSFNGFGEVFSYEVSLHIWFQTE